MCSSDNHRKSCLDQKKTAGLIENGKRLLRPNNLSSTYPGKGFNIFEINDFKVGF